MVLFGIMVMLGFVILGCLSRREEGKQLMDAGVPDELIYSGCIDLSGYKAHLLESAGYMQASGETGYLLRNSREFIRDFTAQEQGGMTMQ